MENRRLRSKDVQVLRKSGRSKINHVLFEYPPPTTKQDSSTNIITFTMHDKKLLQSPNFLNDTIISLFMQLHLDNEVPYRIKKRIHVFSTFFYSKIKSIRENDMVARRSTSASRWIKDVSIFEKDFLILPICERDHWILVIVCYPANYPSRESHILPDKKLYEPAVIILNSFTKCAPGIKKTLSLFLQLRWLTEKHIPRQFPINNSKKSGIRLLFPQLPQQKNNYNCGIYMLNFFYCFLKNPRSSYLRIFRNQSLIDWFSENSIDISRGRLIMTDIVKKHIQSWTETKASRESVTCNEITEEQIDSDEQDSIIVLD